MVTNTRTQDLTLIRERLLDELVIRHAHSIPTISALPKEATTNRLTEWGVHIPFASGNAIRTISAPHATAQLEGADFTDADIPVPTKLRCITEIKHRSMKMTGSAIPAVVAGAENPWDLNSGILFTQLLNDMDNTALYGLGGDETTGTTLGRRTQGLISCAAVTGLERIHGTGVPDAINDPTNVSIPKAYWSVFYDAEGKNLTSDLMFNQILVPLLRNGAQMGGAGWKWMLGYTLMGRVSRFINPEAFVSIETKNRDASSNQGQDYMTVWRFPTGEVAQFQTNRWLDESGVTYSIGSVDPVTPGTPTSPGTVAARTFQGNATMIGWEPGRARILYYRDPGYRKIETVGDYSRIAALAEFAVQVDHPLCIAGGGNLLA